MNGKIFVEELKQLQKIHCKPCSASYEACQSCRFHRITNGLLAEALNERRQTLSVEIGVLLPESLKLLNKPEN